ncbi:MAG: site-specific integrase [Euryarchaeota archaeon]|nr:site-specific integrase [Euryarchaeota archaeon]MDE1837157.1 site-specific integrase [Euryarchaeota archaeon]MDE1881453.1 site-specific integrase [Euryarchaeota archaeon]MDE2046334.1 site-specific integrase [Thermoplasmata archaeon]
MPRRPSDGIELKTFLSDPEVRRWYDNVARGSLTTAAASARSLRHFALFAKQTPAVIARLKEQPLHNLLLDYVSSEQRRGIAGTTTRTRVAAVKSWLLFHGIRVQRPVKIRGTKTNPTLAEERTPTQEELRRIFLAASPRNRVSSVLMAHAGLRPEVLSNYRGEDGLRVGDLPDLEVRGKSVEFLRTPAMVIVRPELSKAGHRYFSFLSREGCDYLREYLESRLRSGEALTARSGIIRPEAGPETLRGQRPFLWTFNVSKGVRVAIRGAGLSWRPYVLRAYFDTQLLIAESKGKVAHDYRVFWMGHKGSMEARYTTNKGRLPTDLLDDMREAYARCEPFVCTIPVKTDNDVLVEMRRTMLLGLGYAEEELKGVDMAQMDLAEFQSLIERKRGAPAARPKQQKLIDASDLGRYLEEGWTVVMPVNGQVVVNPPSR